jgi:hypothetical protein
MSIWIPDAPTSDEDDETAAADSRDGAAGTTRDGGTEGVVEGDGFRRMGANLLFG